LEHDRTSLTIVVPNFNGVDCLKSCLPRLVQACRESTVHGEIILVDNASSDESVDFTRRFFPEVRVLQLDKNYGFAETCDRGIRASSFQSCLLFNNDAWIDARSLDTLAAAMSSAAFSAIGPRILNPDGTFQSGPMTIDILGDPAQRHASSTPFYVSGAAILLDKESYWAVGGFDGRFFAFYEEADLQWRLRLTGREIGYVPSAVVYHVGGSTLQGALFGTRGVTSTSSLRLFLGRRNQLAMLLRNYSAVSLCMILPLWATFGCVEALGCLLVGFPQPSQALLRAVIWNIRQAKTTMRLRRRTQRQRTVGDATLHAHFAPPFQRLRWALRLLEHRSAISVG